MIDITHKINTLRHAKAQAVVTVSKKETIEAIINKSVPKGDVFEMAKTAGLFAVKKTSELIPDCHPLPIEFAQITYEISGLEIRIHLDVKTIYKTGVEVEAMHGVSVVALTMYDMLKPIDKKIEISSIRLLEKKGGKSDFKNYRDDLKIAVVVCSDSVSKGLKEDSSGKLIQAELERLGLEASLYMVIPDEQESITSSCLKLTEEAYDLLIFSGGTGLSDRDVTPEAIRPLLDREIDGIMEAARAHGQERTPFSMLSRSVAGMRNNTLILTFPGSEKAVKEYMNALFPYVLHVFRLNEENPHGR